MAVQPGDIAPDFTLPATGGRTISLSSFKGNKVVLVFYPGDDTAVCTKQLNSYNNELEAFSSVGAQVLAISAQDISSHEQFSGKYNFGFPLLSDPDKEVATLYGTVGPLGFPRRSIFVVDSEGIVRYAHRAIAGLTFRPVEELVEALQGCN